jgi:hypothetical protein
LISFLCVMSFSTNCLPHAAMPVRSQTDARSSCR